MAQKRQRKPVVGSTNPGQSLLLNTNKRRNRTTVLSLDQSDWAGLPEDLLVLILNRLVTLSDYVHFTAVCMPWYTVALKKYHGESRLKLFMHQPPLLFLSHTQSSKKGEATMGIHNITQNKTYKLKSLIPNDRKIRWCGSSHGWLVTVDKDYVITLSNPFCSKVKGGDGIICLPPVPRTKEFGIVKVILSADPIVAPDDYIVMVICTICTIVRARGELAFIRPDDKRWTFVEGSREVVDVIYSEGMLYAVFLCGLVKTWYISGRRPKSNMVSCNYFSTTSRMRSYTVELAGGSILKFVRILEAVRRENVYNKVYYVTKEFKVFKLLVQKPNWVEVETKDRLVLGDGALFLDDNASIYVSAAASKFFGCHSNSIYFTDDCVPSNTYPTGVYSSTPYKVGIFNLEDRNFQWHCVSKFMFSRKSKSRPSWIRPTFQGKLPT